MKTEEELFGSKEGTNKRGGVRGKSTGREGRMMHMYENVTVEPTALCANSNSNKNVCVLKTKWLLSL